MMVIIRLVMPKYRKNESHLNLSSALCYLPPPRFINQCALLVRRKTDGPTFRVVENKIQI